MNRALRDLINKHRSEIEQIFSQEVVEASEQAMDDFVEGLQDPDNPANPYTPQFMAKIKGIMRGDFPALEDDLAANIANGQLEKQLNIRLGLAPEQNFKRAPA